MREPVHIFSVPKNIVNTISVRAGPQGAPTDSADADPPDVEPADPGSSLSCALCLGVTFANLNEQRNHFRSDWHRYNVKTRLHDASSKSVSEAVFADLVEALEDSLSGSASSSSEEDDGGSSDDAVTTLIEKHKKHHVNEDQLDDDEIVIPRSPITWFQSPEAPNTQLGAYNVVFPSSASPEEYPHALRDMQDGGSTGRSWALFMTAGGHFAGMIARVSKPGLAHADSMQSATAKKPKGSKAVPDLEILSHKTFHRYTTRRKQGGSQSVNDNAKGPAKSAGALLRRYGEQALRDDIRALLVEWKDELQNCERIFIRANVSNRRIFLDFDESPLSKGDERLRTFPFQTRRPTLSELTRCLQELTRAKITHFTEEELRVADEAFMAYIQSRRKPPPKPIPQKETVDADKRKKPVEKLAPEEVVIRERWTKLLEMIRKGRLESLKTQWESIRSLCEQEPAPLGAPSSIQASTQFPLVDTRLPAWVQEEGGVGAGGTLLQVATAVGEEAVVQWLLTDQHADPTIPVPASTLGSAPTSTVPTPAVSEDEDEALHPHRPAGGVRKAYDLANKKNIRNVFRRAAYANPDWWDWIGDAHVPSALSPEMEEAEQRKKGVRRKGLKERMKEREDAKRVEQEREKERLEAAARVTQPPNVRSQNKTGPQRLGGPGAVSGASAATLDSMPPEMRARIERERRARAAEARLRNLGGGGH